MNTQFSGVNAFAANNASVAGSISLPIDPISMVISFFESLSMNTPVPSARRGLRGMISFRKIKKFVPILILIILALAAINTLSKRARSSSASTVQKASISGPVAKLELNKNYDFPLLDADGKELSKISYTLENAELRDEIIVQGRRAQAIQGRTFLIVTIKITNNYEKPVNISVRDYIRLIVNSNTEELLAADIHNDPVNVQAISTKTTRIGFPINETDKDPVLLIGEIKGDKQELPLDFK